MGVADLMKSLIPARKVRIGTRCSYGLTELGKTKAETFSLEGPTWNVLAYLDENGPSAINEIVEGVHASPDKTKAILKKLIASGYVMVIGQGS